MVCEICGKAYAAPLTARLTAALQRGAARHQRRAPAPGGVSRVQPGRCAHTMPIAGRGCHGTPVTMVHLMVSPVPGERKSESSPTVIQASQHRVGSKGL